ncbi:MAG TPA: hypothetical protein VGE39_20855 [Prosthecobacter sp.]
MNNPPQPTRRDWLRRGLWALPAVLTGGAEAATASRKTRAQWEFQRKFLASGAAFRYYPRGSNGRPWTTQLDQAYRAYRHDPRVGYAVKNLATGRYLAEFQADNLYSGSSMPKPAVAAVLLERNRGNLSRENFMHIVKACDKSENASWFHMLGLIGPYDEQAFKARYALPNVAIRDNRLSARFYCEFYERCVNYRLDHGCELLLEAMRRDQYGLGRWTLPRSITYIGGKTGNYGEWDHESLFFYHGATPYAIVLFTRGHFAPQGSDWKLGAMMGGLFRNYCA